MSQRSAALLSFIPALAVFVIAHAAVVGSAWSAAECIASPDRAAPAGQHWYYRRDPATKRQCWFLAPRGARVQKPQSQTAKPRMPDALAQAPALPVQAEPPPATTAVGAAAVSLPDSALQLRWPSPDRYTVASAAAEPIEPGAQSEPGAQARPGDDPAATAMPFAEPVRALSQVVPLPAPERTDIILDGRTFRPQEPDHSVALAAIALALLVIGGLIWCVAAWQRRRVRVERAGHVWLDEWRASRRQLAEADHRREIGVSVRASAVPRVAAPQSPPAPGPEPFDWAQQLARAWQQLSEDCQEQQQLRAAAATRR
jgi:hypothetical protein